MKSKLALTSAVLFGLALTAQAQLLGLSIGRHGFSFGIGLPFCGWGPPAVYAPVPVYAGPAPVVHAPPPASYYPGPVPDPPPAPVMQAQVWVPSGPLPGKWVPEPNPYRYAPASSTVPTQRVTVVTKGTGGMLVYSSR